MKNPTALGICIIKIRGIDKYHGSFIKIKNKL